nr:reverse transcriptase domain-containing protein [Tanacetum cinerariifolium]
MMTDWSAKARNHRRSKQRIEPFSLEETPVVTMADQRTMAELLQAPTEGYKDIVLIPAILAENFELKRTMAELLQAPTEGYRDIVVIPAILAENFKLKHALQNLVTSKQLYGFKKEDPHAHIRWFNKITSMIKYRDVPNSSINLMFFPFLSRGKPRFSSKKNPLQRIDESFCEAWDRFKDLLRACPHYGFTEMHQLDTFYNALTSTDQDSLNAAAVGNLLTKTPRDALPIIKNKSKVRNSQNKPVVTKVSMNAPSSFTPYFLEIAALADAVKAMLLRKSSPPASVKAVEEICVTCGGPHPYHQCLATDGNMAAPVMDMEEDLAALFGEDDDFEDDDFSDDDSEGVEEEEVWGVNEEWLMAPITPPPVPAVQPPSVYEVGGPSTVAAKGPSFPFPTPGLPIPSSVIEDLSTRLGNLKYGHGQVVKKVIHVSDAEVAAGVFLSRRLDRGFLILRDRKLHFDLSFADALLHMPKFATMFKSLLNNKENLFDLATTPVNENCLAVILKKLPEKLTPATITFKVGQTLKYSYKDAESIIRIDVIDVACEEYVQEVLGFLEIPKSGNPTPNLDPIIALSSPSLTPFEGGDFILEEIEACLLLNDDPSSPLPPKELNLEELKTVKSSIDDPQELKLKDLPSHLEYAFLEGTDKLPIIIAKNLKEDEKMDFPDSFRYLLTGKTKRRPPLLALMEHLPTDVCFSAYVMLRARSKVEAVLGQRKTKHFQPIHYASKTMTDDQSHYTTTEKELLAVVYAFEKSWPYLVLSETIVYTDHLALKYLLAKQDAKLRLLWWILLLQEFDVIIREKKRSGESRGQPLVKTRKSPSK